MRPITKHVRIWVREYYYFVFRFFFSITHRVPARWSVGEKGTVVFIPGFGARATYYWDLCDSLNKHGYKVITIPELGQNIRKVSYEAHVVAKKLMQIHHAKDVVFVTHSKGGVIAKYILDYHPEIQVKKCITIGAPFGGTRLSFLKIYHLDELNPESSLIKNIHATQKNNHLIHQIIAKIDNHVIPYQSLYLQGVHIHTTSVIGHTLMSQEPEVLMAVLELLEAK